MINLKLLDQLFERIDPAYREIGKCVDRAIAACKARGGDPVTAMDAVLREAMGEYNQMYPCVHCGSCCCAEPCQHGAWNTDRTRCQFLTADNRCQRYPAIKGDRAIFGTGCAAPYNPLRNAILKRQKEEV